MKTVLYMIVGRPEVDQMQEQPPPVLQLQSAPAPLSKYERARRGLLTVAELREQELAWLRGFSSAPICTPARTGLLGWLRGRS